MKKGEFNNSTPKATEQKEERRKGMGGKSKPHAPQAKACLVLVWRLTVPLRGNG
jgi:hypothetical protein